MNATRSGGCLCGVVRYEADWPPQAIVVCHCRNCQKQSGSALSIVAMFARDGLRVAGDMNMFEDQSADGQPVFRHFCSQCGSPLVTDTPTAQQMGHIFLKAGTLDETADLKPTVHFWSCRAHNWFVFPNGVQCMEQQLGE